MEEVITVNQATNHNQRRVRFCYFAEPIPQPRQNRNTRWGDDKAAVAAQRYNEWRATFHDEIKVAMLQHGIEQFPAAPLALKVEFYFTRSYRHCDLSNLVKALEDCLNKTIITDDRWIDEISASRHIGVGNYIVFEVRYLL